MNNVSALGLIRKEAFRESLQMNQHMNLHLYLLRLFFLIAVPIQLSAQCGIVVDAGQDIGLCAPGGQVTLNGSVSGGDILGVSWEPSIGLSDPNSLMPSVFVSSTTTYTLTAQTIDSDNNLITNGDFSAGNTGFTSDYDLGTGGPFGLLSTEGAYAIATNASATHNNFAPCTDHTGGGNMMVVNGATTANENVWCQMVVITPNTDYTFSAWLTSVISENPAVLQFSINGTLLGSPFSASPTTCAWNEFSETWNSGSSTSAEICIVNQNTQGSGNDFAIDDLFFTPLCEQTDEVTIEVISVDAIVPPLQTIACDAVGNDIVLDGSGSSNGPSISYQWTTSDGLILSGSNQAIATVSGAGTYILNVIFNDGNTICSAFNSVDVVGDNNVPFAIASVFDEITCADPNVSITGIGSTTGGSIVYNWTTTDGNIVSGDNSLNPVVNMAGTYELTVLNLDNGCTDSAIVMVEEDITPPTVQINAPGTLDCNNSSISLDGTGSSVGPNFDYTWTTIDGNIVSGGTTLSPLIDEAGTYQLVIINTENSCVNFSSITVSGDTNVPLAVAATPPSLTCSTTTLSLDGTGSSTGPAYTYLWSTTDGNIVSGDQSLLPIIDEAGTYELEVTNVITGCVTTTTVTVSQSATLPQAMAAMPPSLTCSTTTLGLDGTGSSTGTEYTYLWTTTDGNIVSGDQSLMPTIDEIGTYELEVTNTMTGCTNTTTVTVSENTTLPQATAATPPSLTCSTTTLGLDGTGSSTGTEYTYLWTTTDGNIVSGDQSLMPTIDEIGTYELEVTNTMTGCTNTTTVTVSENITLPQATAATPPSLTCSTTTLGLDGTGSSTGTEYTYLWTTTDGNIVSGDQSLMPTIDEIGTYELAVTNTMTGCTNTTTVTVSENITLPQATAAPPPSLTCTATSLNLDGTGSSSGSMYTYLWSTTDGNIVSGDQGLMPLINASGTYELEVTNTTTGCTNTVSVMVPQDASLPQAMAATPPSLTCLTTDLNLDGTGSSTGTEYTYLWTTADGNIVSGDQSLMPMIDAEGTYELEVTNTTTGCTAITSVIVSENITLPQATAATPPSLTCLTTDLNLDGTGSSTGTEYTYLWTTTDGNIVSGDQGLMPTIDEIGTYELEVTNIMTGCTNTTTVTVSQDTSLPQAVVATPASLTCTTTMLSLDGGGSSTGAAYTYLWTTTDGNIVSGDQGLMPMIDAEGTYELEVTNTTTGCTANTSVTISENTSLPQAMAAAPPSLTCSTTTLNLDGTGSSTGTAYTYLWTTTDGNIISGYQSLMPMIDAEGTYELEVTNTMTGCTNTTSITVSENITLPQATAATPPVLTCAATTLSLDGTGSTTGPAYTYLWTTTDGNIVSGYQSLMPMINASGTYELEVTNTTTGCTNTTSVIVSQDTSFPIAFITPPTSLTCSTTSLSLDGTGSSTGTEYTYLWSTTDGNIVSGDQSLMPTIDEIGTYELQVTNTDNNCIISTSIVVGDDLNAPVADAGSTFQLDCNMTTAFLSGNNSSQGSTFTYQWSTTNGNIIAGDQGLSPEISTAGTYELVVTDTNNGCTANNMVTITQDSNLPTAIATVSAPLTCVVTDLEIDASNSSSGANFSIAWTTTDGNIIANQNTLTPTVDAPGTYTLTILNTLNNCEVFTSVLVEEEVVVPMVEAGIAFTLDCNAPQNNLDPIGSSLGSDFQLAWSTLDGNLVGMPTETNPLVDAAGTYLLTITDLTNGCTSSDEVIIIENFATPVADAGPPQTIDCTNDTLALGGNNTSIGSEFIYEWNTPDGNVIGNIDTMNASVNASGIYTLLVTNSLNGCTNESTVFIDESVDLPLADAGTAATLNCLIDQVMLNGMAEQGNITYEWVTTDGNIVSGGNTLNPLVDAPGMYALIVTDPLSSCSSSAMVNVVEDIAAPIAEAGPTFELTCDVLEASLDGSNSNIGLNYTYAWTTSDGNIISGANGIAPLIDASGIYTLVVTNTQNGCLAIDNVQITQNEALPQVNIATPDMLNCQVTGLTLSGQGSSTGNNITYQWNTVDGSILSGANSLMPQINMPGTYSLSIFDSDNNCENTASILVEEDLTLPDVVIENADELNCDVLTLTLDGQNSSQGNNFNYTWTTTDGNIINGGNSLTPQINAPGNYELLITNTLNGCTEMAMIEIDQDIAVPIVQVLSPDELTCVTSEVQLDATASNSGANFDLIWATTNGNILSGGNSLTPSINEPGTYFLTIQNTENGCEEDAQVIVTQDIVAPMVNAGQDVTINCHNDPITLEGNTNNGGFSIAWSSQDGNIIGAANTLAPLIDFPGTYVLNATNLSNGCTATDSVFVAQIILSDFDFSVAQPTCLLPTGSIEFDTVQGGTPPYVYSIDGGNSFQEISTYSNLQADNYDLVVQDLNGCEETAQSFITAPEEIQLVIEPTVDLLQGDTYQVNTQLSLLASEIDTIIWFPAEGLDCTDCLEPLAQPLQNREYTLNIISTEGCEATASIAFRVDRNVSVYFPNIFSPNGDGDNDFFHPFANRENIKEVKTFQIFDRWGEVVFVNNRFLPNDQNEGWDGTLRGEALRPAVFVYFAEVELLDGSIELYKGDITLMK